MAEKKLGWMKVNPAKWKLLGCGDLKLNKKKDEPLKTRLLMRESCGRHPTKIREIIINSNVGPPFYYLF